MVLPRRMMKGRLSRDSHKMISRFHPDSLNEVGEAHIQRAQEINEAYRILCQSDKWEMKSGQGTEAHGAERDHRYGNAGAAPGMVR